ncbi:hypothetical protein IW262DRAFT_1293875 [Armillaria fumosa]|nr:hypothetical protein IW262DRAFT_1293875 [Armillaria fumosa]
MVIKAKIESSIGRRIVTSAKYLIPVLLSCYASLIYYLPPYEPSNHPCDSNSGMIQSRTVETATQNIVFGIEQRYFGAGAQVLAVTTDRRSGVRIPDVGVATGKGMNVKCIESYGSG